MNIETSYGPGLSPSTFKVYIRIYECKYILYPTLGWTFKVSQNFILYYKYGNEKKFSIYCIVFFKGFYNKM